MKPPASAKQVGELYVKDWGAIQSKWVKGWIEGGIEGWREGKREVWGIKNKRD